LFTIARGDEVIEFHPLAGIFDLLEGEDFRRLVEDICAKGLY
jgi:hypothetical protein